MKKNIKAIILGLAIAISVGYVSAWTGAPANPPDNNVEAPINTSSFAQAKIGGLNIGTTTINPNTKLNVENGTIRAGGGLIIETRASNPTSPETGRLWIITP